MQEMGRHVNYRTELWALVTHFDMTFPMTRGTSAKSWKFILNGTKKADFIKTFFAGESQSKSKQKLRKWSFIKIA